jgi:predicted nucleic acid-binding protein
MILYLDTSSLVKLYLDEVYSEAVHRWAQEAEVLATSRVAYPETLAALARRWREGVLTDETHADITNQMQQLDSDSDGNVDDTNGNGLADLFEAAGFTLPTSPANFE